MTFSKSEKLTYKGSMWFHKNKSKVLYKIFFLYFIVILLYAVFSYSLTAPNLVLTSWPSFWNFQTWMWETFFNNRPLLSYVFSAIITVMFLCYGVILLILKKNSEVIKTSKKHFLKYLTILLILISPLMLSNNALSYDVFNYIFNAKMVLVYKANPHRQVALDFSDDNWTRFMHNTHTPAPYGYGWTAFSLIPSTLGGGKFLPTWLLFRVASLVSLGLLGWLIWSYQNKYSKNVSTFNSALVLLNPLLLIEVISNSHNDLWMMVPALASIILVLDVGKKKNWFSLALISLALLIFSISIKLATIVLVPLWLALVLLPSLKSNSIQKIYSWLQKWWPLLASFALFLPLLTLRSKQFLPWYLIWSLVWIPFFPTKIPDLLKKFQFFWKYGLVVLSVSALARYLPFLLSGEYSLIVETQQRAVVWLPFLIYLIASFFLISLRKIKDIQ